MEPQSPLSRYVAQNSKKREFHGATSFFMDFDAVEISPPIARSLKLKSLEIKKVTCPEVIDVDADDECGDVVVLDSSGTPGQGKEAAANFSVGSISATKFGSGDEVKPSKASFAPLFSDFIKPGVFDPNLNYDYDDYMDMHYEDLIYDYYKNLQSQFDGMEIPPGLETPIPLLLESALDKTKTAHVSSPALPSSGIHSDAGSSTETNLSQPLWLAERAETGENSSSMKMPSLHHVGLSHKRKTPMPSSVGGQKKEKSMPLSHLDSSLHAQKADGNLPPRMEHFNYEKPSELEKLNYFVPQSTTYHGLHNTLPSVGASYFSTGGKSQLGSNLTPSTVHLTADAFNFPSGFGLFKCLDSSATPKYGPSMIPPVYHGFADPLGSLQKSYNEEEHSSWAQYPVKSQKRGTANAGKSMILSGSSVGGGDSVNEEEIMQKYHLFKKIDTVQDCSDHHYSQSGSSVKKPSKSWAKKIQEEWKILEKDLPDSIFVRVYESRMDLLRAVIVGAEATPYHDGLFFFDVFFPSSYPTVPPRVYYHSGGLRLNPNLYNCGKVCLSLLNTWSGSQKEKWIPGVSTMLQVLVSIQGLILNAKPFFNEPGFENMSGSVMGEQSSLHYNENTFILSLKTMVYNMRRPPKHFEDFVLGHFFIRAHDIMVSCKAYLDGAQVGCLVRGGVQDVDEGDKSSSPTFKQGLTCYIHTLLTTFTHIGVKDCEMFRLPTQSNMHMPVSAASKG